ncbi:MAG: two-component regulator propeller domain-containing protein, partial [Bacteroidota bacterium]|nr:two-component regulator propeller domain-containing protein [Bacteroidota bacterium]
MKKFPGTALALILIPGIIGAQQKEPNFINFSNKEGLSSNCVTAICKDSHGYMWFATDDGLNKFDGANFTIYRHNANDSGTVGGNDINALCEDRHGNLWVGANHALSRYDREKDAFTNYGFMGNSAIRAICEDHTGDLWVGGYSGLYRFNPVNDSVRMFRASPKPGHLLSNTVLCIFEDRRRRLWVGTNAGLNCYQRDRDDFLTYRHAEGDPNSIAGNIVRSITEDSAGHVWFGTSSGLSELRPDGRSFTNYVRSGADSGSQGFERIYAVRADKENRLWIGTEEGLIIFDPGSGRSQRIVRDQRNKYSLVGNSVRSIFIDGNGLYWIGSYQGGINKYDENLAFFNFRGSNPFDPAGLRSPIVTSFAEGLSGDIYVGTDGGGLNLYHRQTGLFEHPVLTKGVESNTLSILALERAEKDLWIGTYQQGVYVLDLITGGVRHYTQGDGPNGLCGNEVFCLKKDRHGNVWIGTNGKGVAMCPAGSQRFERPGASVPGQGGSLMSNAFIRAIEEDAHGNIWIGTSGAGIIVYDPVRKSAKVLDHDNNNLPSNVVLSLHLDRDGRIWAGSQGGGLSLFEQEKGNFISYSEQEGISNAVIYKILEDVGGKLWVSTNRGISSFNRETRRFKNYSYQNGLQRSTFSRGAGLASATGELFFGGLDGFNYFDPLSLPGNKIIPSLQFTALKIANRTVIPGPNEPIREHISDAREVRLAFKQNFSIDFIALNYTTPQECRYAYKLDGFDRDWNLVGSSHTAIYTNLDPGEYTFRAKATSDDGSWSTPEKIIRITVRPPFYRTAYAYALYVLMAILLVVLLRFIGIRRLKNRFAIEQERIRTRQMIEQERKEAERQHEFDELKIKFLTNLSHEFRTPVSLMVGPIDRLLSQEENAEKMTQLSMVRRNANRLLNLVNQLLDFKQLEKNELNLHLTEGDLISFLRDIAESFHDTAQAKQIDFSFSSSVEQYYTRFDRDKIDRVLLNLLSNAFKFTPKQGKIRIGVDRAEGSEGVKLSVSDSGIGMSAEVRDKIFTRFFQANEKGPVLNQGSGIGLSIAREFVKLHGGTINVTSAPGHGSTFTILLPCPLLPGNAASPDLPAPPNRAMTTGRSIQPAPVFQNVTVLLIEDNDDFRHYLRDSLKPFYRIVEASNGKEGWQKVLSAHPM